MYVTDGVGLDHTSLTETQQFPCACYFLSIIIVIWLFIPESILMWYCILIVWFRDKENTRIMTAIILKETQKIVT